MRGDLTFRDVCPDCTETTVDMGGWTLTLGVQGPNHDSRAEAGRVWAERKLEVFQTQDQWEKAYT